MSLFTLLQKWQNLTISLELKQSLKNFFDVRYTYNTNAIEWTTFSEKETALVLKGQTISNHPLKEHLEVINHKKAFDFIWNLTNWLDKSNKSWLEIFSEENVLNIHKILLTNINDPYAWVYRDVNVRIAFSTAVLPRYEKVPDLMYNFFDEFKTKFEKLDLNNLEEVVRYWYDLHLQFVKIHPFIDWNWRTARLLMNMRFLRSLNVVNVIYYKYRNQYILSLEKSDEDINYYYNFMNKNFEEFLVEIFEIVENKIYWKY